MSQELRPGVFRAIFERMAAKGEGVGAGTLTALALAIERQAKLNLGKSSHPYGTRTPARVGGPPSLVSGTLRRSVTHSRPTRGPAGWEVRVGLARGFYPPYPRKGKRTQSSRYGYYLETGQLNRGGAQGPSAAYPFLVPAFKTVMRSAMGGQVGKLLNADWRDA